MSGDERKEVHELLSEIEHQVDTCHSRACKGFALFGEDSKYTAGILFEDLRERLCTIQVLLEKMPKID